MATSGSATSRPLNVSASGSAAARTSSRWSSAAPSGGYPPSTRTARSWSARIKGALSRVSWTPTCWSPSSRSTTCSRARTARSSLGGAAFWLRGCAAWGANASTSSPASPGR
eukprot:5933097-Alexandrium_andersonii.AAC.1